jgi:hypothetical protein
MPLPGCGGVEAGGLVLGDDQGVRTPAVGDPAVDLLPTRLFLPAGARDVFRAALDVGDATWTRGRGWAPASSLPVPDDPFFVDRRDRVNTALHLLDELVADLQVLSGRSWWISLRRPVRCIARRRIVLVLGVLGRLKTTRRGAVPDVAGPRRSAGQHT